MKKTNRKNAILCACATIPVIVAGVFLGKAVKSKKSRKYGPASF